MAKQNVVVPEQVVKATTVPSASTPAPSMLSCPPRSMSSACPMKKNKYLKQLEIGPVGAGGGRINPCVDSMKASSPTAVAMDERMVKSMAKHPSALAMFAEIFKASAGKQIVVFLDYDGTLSPIVADPDRAFMSQSMRDVVKEVAKYFPTAIVSGRRRDKVYDLVQLAELYYAGSHGMDIKGPAKCPIYIKGATQVMFQPASEFAPMIDEVFKILVGKTATVPGARVENHKFCLSVHYRCVEEKRWPGLLEEVKSVLEEYPKLLLTYGRKVLDIRPTIKWDKGKALEFLLESLGFGDCSDVLPVYIGDDRTDEDAFKVLRNRGQGVGILVSKIPKETNASYSLQEPSEVKDFLRRLVDWKKLSQGTVKGG